MGLLKVTPPIQSQTQPEGGPPLAGPDLPPIKSQGGLSQYSLGRAGLARSGQMLSLETPIEVTL